MLPLRCFFALVPGLAATTSLLAADYKIVVAPADFDRAAEVVTVALPADAPKPAVLRDAGNQTLSLQVDEKGNGTFFIAAQKAGQSLTYSLVAAPPKISGNVVADNSTAIGTNTTSTSPVTANVSAGVEVTKEPGRLRLAVNSQPVFYYQMDLEKPPRDGVDPKFLRGAFLHPVYSPAGKLVTDDYPTDHFHHHGIWVVWTDTLFEGRNPDFWNMGQANGGTVEFVALDKSWSGPVAGGFEARHRFVDRMVQPAVTVLDERWQVTLYAAEDVNARVFDLAFTHTAATSDPLTLVTYRYGGLGVRGAAEWLDKANCVVLNSEGLTDRVKSEYQRAKWYFMGGKVGGALAGIAILDHPDNFRAPQPVWMNADQPFFCYAPEQLGDFQITKDKPYAAHYRFVVVDGPPDAKFLEACWQGYAHPGVATVTPQ